MIDDSSLFHGTYDPVKAREYYLRTRKLKGKRPTTATVPAPGRGGRRPASAAAVGTAKPNRSDTKSRQAQLAAQREALQKRLEHLRDVLEELVDAAKKRSGVKDPKHDSKDKAPETKVDKADRNKAEKDRKPLTAKQKADKAQKAKKEYEKEHPTSLSQDIDVLQLQVKDIQAKIQRAMKDAQHRRQQAGPKATFVQQSPKPNDGPRGR